jgi:cytochrome P450
MTTISLDRERIRDLFDLRLRANGGRYVNYTEDPYPSMHRLRETGPVHEGTMHELIGYEGPASFHGVPDPSRPHFSVFSFAECDAVYRNETLFRSAPPDQERDESGGIGSSMIYMNGDEHRRYRALVQPSFAPGKAKWWSAQWIDTTVHGLIDGFEADGRAELNIDFDAVIPMLTITGSFGLSIEEALDVRAALEGFPGGRSLNDYILPIIAARRAEPQDDLISMLCHSEVKDEDGSTHRLSDEEIMGFSNLLLAAGSGTTWKQMGITLIAMLTTPGVIDEVRQDRSLLRSAIDESLRWNVTDPMFTRWPIEATTIGGVDVPAGAAVHLCIGSANRDPARWENPDAYDIHRPLKSSLGFAQGAHICLGMHVARAELTTAIGALLDRLPNLRLDPQAEPPAVIGLYERGPSHIPVLWG